MPTINITTISDGSVASSSQVNTPLNTIVNAINGNLDSDNLAANAVTTAKIADANVTADKINLGVGSQSNTSDTGTTTSTSYTATLTSGGTNPSVTVTIGANGNALVSISSRAGNSSADAQNFVTFVASGANTIAAGDMYALHIRNSTATATTRSSAVILLTGLTAGSTTFTMNYKVSAGTGSFSSRNISVVPL